MKKILRQTALGVGTFGTGCALLALSVNPYLLVLTDTVVGVGMLFAAGSVSMNDLHLKKGEAAGEAPAAATESVPGGTDGVPAGLLASLGKLKGSLKPPAAPKAKEEKETRVKEIDRMLDTTLAGQSKRLISLAEGQGTSPAKAVPAAPPGPAGKGAAATGTGGDLLEEFTQAQIAIPFGEEEEPEGEGAAPAGAGPAAAMAGLPGAGAAPLPGLGEISEAASRDAVPEPEELGADDLLSALRAEAMREKKKDDTSLVRDLKGVKVTGKQLLEELDSLVRDIRGR